MRDFIVKQDNTAPAPSGILSADEDNARFAELKKAVATAGLTPDPVGGPDSNLYQLAEAMARYASGGVFCVDSGAANAYVLAAGGSFKMPASYFDGMTIVFFPANSCTGAATVNVNGVGVKNLLGPDGQPLAADDVQAGQLCAALYDASADGGAGAFRLAPWAVAGSSSSAGTYLNLPIYPEVVASSKILSVSSPSAGVVQVDDGGSFVHRGFVTYQTTDAPLADRQFTTAPGATYHLRWQYNGGAPQYVLRNLTDPGYNPGGLAETDAAFDTTFDDMLLARVVTDGGNVATITALKNADRLTFSINFNCTDSAANGDIVFGAGNYVIVPVRTDNGLSVLLLPPVVTSINFSRTPDVLWSAGHWISGNPISDSPVILTRDGYVYSDGTGSAAVLNNRYDQYPVARLDTNSYSTWKIHYTIKGVGDA